MSVCTMSNACHYNSGGFYFYGCKLFQEVRYSLQLDFSQQAMCICISWALMKNITMVLQAGLGSIIIIIVIVIWDQLLLVMSSVI